MSLEGIGGRIQASFNTAIAAVKSAGSNAIDKLMPKGTGEAGSVRGSTVSPELENRGVTKTVLGKAFEMAANAFSTLGKKVGDLGKHIYEQATKKCENPGSLDGTFNLPFLDAAFYGPGVQSEHSSTKEKAPVKSAKSAPVKSAEPASVESGKQEAKEALSACKTPSDFAKVCVDKNSCYSFVEKTLADRHSPEFLEVAELTAPFLNEPGTKEEDFKKALNKMVDNYLKLGSDKELNIERAVLDKLITYIEGGGGYTKEGGIPEELTVVLQQNLKMIRDNCAT